MNSQWKFRNCFNGVYMNMANKAPDKWATTLLLPPSVTVLRNKCVFK